jgi:hypothetical protein
MIPMRPAMSLDGAWAFVPDPGRRLAADRLPAGTDITVPGAWEAQIAPPYGVVHGWYRRRFAVPADWPAGDLVLRFEAVSRTASVWLDGRLIARNDLAFLPFEVDAGPAETGAEHELAVGVTNPLNVIAEYPAFGRDLDAAVEAAAMLLDGERFDALPHGKETWYTSTSGLLGSVTARAVGRPRIRSLRVEPDAADGRVAVRWDGAAVSSATDVEMDLMVTDPAGRVVAERSVPARDGRAVLTVARPDLWGLWAPALYRLDARLGAATRLDDADHATVRFGFRSIAVRDGTIVLNGQRFSLRGALDQDFWPLGRWSPPSRDALVEQVRLVREAGLDLLRCHIKIPSADYLDVADEAGLPLWCELPSWRRPGDEAWQHGRRTLDAMVDVLGHHPSIVAWTIINEDWGTDLRHSARDRRWLRTTVDWLRERDPTRLVVDNSACETPAGPTFHLRTDIADFHAYRSVPDGGRRWRSLVGELATRPAWLWSPFGDAAPTGQEPIILSEFGPWGLPRPSGLRDPDAGDPWWSHTGPPGRRPAGFEARFRAQGLGRIWSDPDALAVATQTQQVEGLASQIRELRRHRTVAGYVITELADMFWEANGLLDVARRPKASHHRLAEINAPDVLIVDLPRTDLWAGERIAADVMLASHADPGSASRAGGPGRIDWTIRLRDGAETTGVAPIEDWPAHDVRRVARIDLVVPTAAAGEPTEGELVAVARGEDGRTAVHRQRCVVVPSVRGRREAQAPARVAVVDPLGTWGIAATVSGLGYDVVSVEEAPLIVATAADAATIAAADEGRSLVLLARASDALTAATGLARPAAVVSRDPGPTDVAPRRPWDGDWTSVFAWALPGVAPGLPDGGLLHEAHAEVYPDHVITGLDVADPSDGVRIGLFAGWVDGPAAILASFPQGRGWVTLTTLRLSPEHGPVATALLGSLLRGAIDGLAT